MLFKDLKTGMYSFGVDWVNLPLFKNNVFLLYCIHLGLFDPEMGSIYEKQIVKRLKAIVE